ncbi:hypothetical protein FQR65_LT20662 [Abscondita terminalis]|nr:hypothetical protein FQR65_LT20662 [Abscondita terminalis]
MSHGDTVREGLGVKPVAVGALPAGVIAMPSNHWAAAGAEQQGLQPGGDEESRGVRTMGLHVRVSQSSAGHTMFVTGSRSDGCVRFGVATGRREAALAGPPGTRTRCGCADSPSMDGPIEHQAPSVDQA